MPETLHLRANATKSEIYEEILPQIKQIISAEKNLIANLANITAILRSAFGHFWIGFYLREEKQLVLGPFQGPLACTRIQLEPAPRGVCGVAASTQKTQVVPDVDKFPGHIACSSLSKSEIVVPLVHNTKTELVLDIDSTALNTFDETDQKYLEQLIKIIKQHHYK